MRGLVQGVGFRPHVWRLANEAGLAGHVRNDGGGVEIEAWGAPIALDGFVARIGSDAPPLARIDALEQEPLAGSPPQGEFAIAPSAGGTVATGIVPDAATCPDCLAEIRDPGNRRFGYAFTNCTHCGPRLSIVEAIPYDRANTSMRAFAMCADCAHEYCDPADRRFHAQPNACPACGPRLWLEDEGGAIACDDPVAETARRLRAGAIVAIKGIGGFHLACDAANAVAVDELRRRKRRAAKPFAVMARTVEDIRRHCAVSADEEAHLRAPAAPIVLLENTGAALAPGVAPGQGRTGFMLPYSPLHHLLMAALDGPIVLTSGNMSDEPQVTDNDEARTRLSGIADFRLMHDRAIVNRLDDSVARIDTCGPQIIRRARGMAPEPLLLDASFTDAPRVLAMGSELKSTLCLLRGGEAIVSQHLGDLEDAAIHVDYRRTLNLYRSLFDFEPDVIAVDCHPDYLSTRLGKALAAETGARLVEVQHHHAHLASCLAENRVAPGDDRTVGIILDGLGLGTDGTVWGGEILVGGYAGFERAAHFLPVALPGGAQAMREPWRNTVAHLEAAFGGDWRDGLAGTPLEIGLTERPVATLEKMIASGLNSPLSSSAGRLFDAMAAAIGVCADRQHYEGQAAMEMEALAQPFLPEAEAYPLMVSQGDGVRVLSWRPMWEALLRDLRHGMEPGLIAAHFHLALIDGLARVAAETAHETGTLRVALAGGAMQNAILRDGLHRQLSEQGFDVAIQTRMPSNDGGLSLGQAVIAAAVMR